MLQSPLPKTGPGPNRPSQGRLPARPPVDVNWQQSLSTSPVIAPRRRAGVLSVEELALTSETNDRLDYGIPESSWRMWGEAILRWYRFLYYDSVPWTLRWTSSRDDSPEEYHRNLVRGEWLRGGLQGEDLNWLRDYRIGRIARAIHQVVSNPKVRQYGSQQFPVTERHSMRPELSPPPLEFKRCWYGRALIHRASHSLKACFRPPGAQAPAQPTEERTDIRRRVKRSAPPSSDSSTAGGNKRPVGSAASDPCRSPEAKGKRSSAGGLVPRDHPLSNPVKRR